MKSAAPFVYARARKKELRISQLLFSLWTSLGLNQGPPDYESICNIFHKIINNHKTLIFNAFFIL